MKKAIALGAWLLLFTTAAFCQYRGTYWGEPVLDAIKGKHAESTDSIYGYTAMRETSLIMDQKSAFYYLFNSYQELVYIGYIIDAKPGLADKLEAKMKAAGYCLQCEGGTIEYKKQSELDKPLNETFEEFLDGKHPLYLIIEDLETTYNGGDSIISRAREVGKIEYGDKEYPVTEELIEIRATVTEWTYGTNTCVFVLQILDKILVLYTNNPGSNF